MLTSKQELFAQNIVAGLSGKDSYITAYKNNCNDNTAYKESMKLLARTDIQDRIKELRKPLEIQAQTKALTAREQQLEFITSRIEHCIANDDEQALIRYTDMLNKIHGLYKETQEIEQTSTGIDKLDSNTLLKLVN